MDDEFKKELKVILASEENNSLLSNIRNVDKKRVSWVNTQEDVTQKIPFRSTPYPNRVNKIKNRNGISAMLSFSDEDSDVLPSNVDNSNGTASSINECQMAKKKIKHPRKRIKLSKNPLMKGIIVKNTTTSNDWIETNISSPISSESSLDSSSEPISEQNFDPDNKLASKILANIKKANLFKNDSDTSDLSDLSFDFDNPGADQIELINGISPLKPILFADSTGDLDIDSISSDSNDSFTVPSILKYPKKFERSCQINEPILTKQILPDAKEKNISKFNSEIMQNSNDETCTEDRDVDKSMNISDISLNYTNGEDDEKTESTDDDFLMNVDENVDNDMKKYSTSFFSLNEVNNDCNDSVQYFMSAHYCIFVLKHPTKLYFHGKLSVSVLSGAIEVLGFILEDHTKDAEIYSPRGSSYLCLETVQRKTNENLNCLLKHYDLNEKTINFNDETEDMCVIAVKNLKNKILNCLEEYMPQQFFPKIDIYAEENRPFSIPEKKLQCLFETQPSAWPVYRKGVDWKSIIKLMQLGVDVKRSCTFICGGKGVGKSTFLRYTINKLLNNEERVVCIDLDPGQPEFSIPGCISVTIIESPLLGPNYTHLQKPVSCHFLGDVNIAHCFDRYLQAVSDLMTFCNENIDKTVPWVINYMGFTKSLGLDLVISVVKIVNPSVLVQIQSSNAKLNFDSVLSPEFMKKQGDRLSINLCNSSLSYKIRAIKSVTSNMPGKWEIEPKLIRDMCIISYFSQMLDSGDEDVSTVTPYVVDLSSIKLSHINNLSDNLPAILNGNMVALCTDVNSKCHGFGIIRGIDTISKKLYLCTPLSEDVLETVTNLIMGLLTIPTSMYLRAGQHEGFIPYVSLGTRHLTSVIPKRAYRPCKFLVSKK